MSSSQHIVDSDQHGVFQSQTLLNLLEDTDEQFSLKFTHYLLGKMIQGRGLSNPQLSAYESVRQTITSEVSKRIEEIHDTAGHKGDPILEEYLQQWCRDQLQTEWFNKESFVSAQGTASPSHPHPPRHKSFYFLSLLMELAERTSPPPPFILDCIRNLLGPPEAVKYEIDVSCQFLHIAGQIIDKPLCRPVLDAHFSRLRELSLSKEVPLTLRTKLKEVIALRARKWAALPPGQAGFITSAAAVQRALPRSSSLVVVARQTRGLLDKLTMENFDSISDQVITLANVSEEEKDARSLIIVIKVVFEQAINDAARSEMYARLCRKMMEQIGPKVQDDGVKDAEGKPITGGQLFRKYLLNRCQEDFERGWVATETTATTKAMADQAAKAANDKNKEGEAGEEIVLYSEGDYAAQKAKRQGLGLIKFIGELFKLQMLTERIMHECVKKLLGNVENPEEEEIESLCTLLSTVGRLLDTQKARAHMDVYFSRMKELVKSGNVTSRMQFMLQDVIELRQCGWVTRSAVAARTRFAPPGPDGWTATPSGPPRPPPKAGDLANFGKISKVMPMAFGPTSVFSGKDKAGNSKRDSLSRSSPSSNMFSMLQNNEAAAEVMAAGGVAKGSRPHSRMTSVDLTQLGGAAEPARRKRILLQPRLRMKPTAEEGVSPVLGPSVETENVHNAEAEGAEEKRVVPEMSEAEADKKIAEDSKEFFAVRNLEEAEVYFTNLTKKFHHRLVNKVASSAVESNAQDAQLVADLFARVVGKQICSPAELEAGLTGIAEVIDDIAIDAPKAFEFFALMVKGAALDDDRKAKLAVFSEDSERLLQLMS